MGTPKEPKPAKYFVALLSAHTDLLTAVEADLSEFLGCLDARSETVPWTASRFYEAEMGHGLLRRFISFERLLSPEALSQIKILTQEIEDRYRQAPTDGRGRQVNCDPGYLEAGKVVLASTKNASQRIYLARGVFAEATMLYHDGGFHACPYTYPDYLWPESLRFLSACRGRYLEQLRRLC
jgi:hypothetical protein